MYLSRHSPVLLLSHGLGGTRESLSWLGDQCSQAGYVVVQLQHPGSDDELVNQLTARELMASVKAKSWDSESRDRLRDVSLVLDALPKWQADSNHFLSSTMDLGPSPWAATAMGL